MSKKPRTDNVESVDSVLQRELSLIDDLEERYQGQTLLLVGHGDPLQILLAWQQALNPLLHRRIPPLGNADIRSMPEPAKQRKTA